MSDMQTTITGSVLTGRGIASKHIESEEASFQAVTSDKLVLGSLNVMLDGPTLFNADTAKEVSDGARLLWPARIGDETVWIYRFPHAPLHVVEVLSKTHLRTAFNLDDGSKVSLTLLEDDIVKLSLRQKIAWAIVWKGRRSWSYNWDRYYHRTRQLSMDLGATQIVSKASIPKAILDFMRNTKR